MFCNITPLRLSSLPLLVQVRALLLFVRLCFLLSALSACKTNWCALRVLVCLRVCSALCAWGYIHLHAVRPDLHITWFESTLVLRRFQSRLLLRRTSQIRNTLHPRVCRCTWLHRKAQCQSAHIWGAVAFSIVVTVNVVPKSVCPEVRVGSSTSCGFVGH